MDTALPDMSNASTALFSAEKLRSSWEKLTRENGNLRPRKAAEILQISEGELIASLVGIRATRLQAVGAHLVEELPSLGPVIALTRNAHCVHEKIGPYRGVTITPNTGLVLGEAIDLRIFPAHWQHAFAVVDDTDKGPRRSIQVFDASGTAVHKIFQNPETDIGAFDALIERWRADDQSPSMTVVPLSSASEDRPDGEADLKTLRREWAALQDTHDFFGMLRRLKVGRHQAMRLVGSDFARAVPAGSLAHVLQAARDAAAPIMVFVGNPGCIQIHTGPVVNLKCLGPWFNVLDADFNLHLREDAIAGAYIVRKPTRDGNVTSLELFDADGFCFVQLFGARKPGSPERDDWRFILSTLRGLS
jgi:putative hemin transport protein